MSKPSPAPWHISEGEIVADDGEMLGVVYRTEAWTSGDPVRGEDQANARLISAAPELLEALNGLLLAFKAHVQWHGEPLVEVTAAEAAIGKARGTP